MPHHLVGAAEIAEMLGVSRQRVAQLMASHNDFPKPEVELAGGRVWSRTAIEAWISAHPERNDDEVRDEMMGFANFDDLARRSVILAQEQARLFKHHYIGTEHLLLGLLKLEDGAAWRALSGLDVTIDAASEQLIEMIGYGNVTPEGNLPFTPRSKKVLESALKHAKYLASAVVSTQHILMALVGESDGVAWQILDRLGLTQAEVTDVAAVAGNTRVVRTEGLSKRQRKQLAKDLLNCSFCGKSQKQVKKLIAGPGVYICNECIDLCNEIMVEDNGEPPTPAPPKDPIDDVKTRLEYLESRFADLESERAEKGSDD